MKGENNSNTTLVKILQAFCPTSLYNDTMKSHATFVGKDAHKQ